MKKTITLKKNYEFLQLYNKGKFYVGKYLVLYLRKNKLGINRIGITTSRKFGNSVKRNRIRRLIKESYRHFENVLKIGYDFVFVARCIEVLPEYNDIKKEMKFLFKKNSVFDTEKWDCLKEL
jgi:ribonuclease P protein component